MFNTKITFALTVALTTGFIFFIDAISENPSPLNLIALTIITIMMTTLFLNKGAK
jgi:uncharacterized membrane protein